jgi:hypothetical protein
MPKKPSDVVGLTLRLKEALRSELERSAKDRGVSLNSEVVRRLEQSFAAREAGDVAAAVARIIDAVGALNSLQGATVDLGRDVGPGELQNKAFGIVSSTIAIQRIILDAVEMLTPASQGGGAR